MTNALGGRAIRLGRALLAAAGLMAILPSLFVHATGDPDVVLVVRQLLALLALAGAVTVGWVVASAAVRSVSRTGRLLVLAAGAVAVAVLLAVTGAMTWTEAYFTFEGDRTVDIGLAPPGLSQLRGTGAGAVFVVCVVLAIRAVVELVRRRRSARG